MYSQHKITPLGVLYAHRVRNPKTKKKYIGEFVVVQEAQTSRSVQAMGLVTIAYAQIQFISERGSAPSPGCTDKEQIFDAYPEVFQGELGLFPGQVHLEVNPAVPTVQSPIHKIPLATRQLLREELNRLEQLDIIEKVDKPTDWVSSLVLVKKPNGTVRICLDPKPLNKALKRSHYPVPTLDDVLPALSQAKVFSIADVRNGFWHLELDTASWELTTFGTPFWEVLLEKAAFWRVASPEVFQMRIHQLLKDCLAYLSSQMTFLLQERGLVLL